VPAPYAHGPHFLLLEYLAPGRPAPHYWPGLGQALARIHTHAHDRFGFFHDNYIGATPQPNTWDADGHQFFAEQRLLVMGQRVHGQGLLSSVEQRRLERLCARLPDLVPKQAPSLLHGDLWSGNIIPGPDGQACLIDPAAHYGWAEADLAMTVLFGRPPAEFFTGYESVRPLAPGYRERFDVYNLYHLLNHVALFGAGYLGAVQSILTRFE
jgi:fructosamine-3-kinase